MAELSTRLGLMADISTKISISDLIVKLCAHFAIVPDTLQLRTRAAGVADVRSIVCYLAVRHLGQNGVEVGRHLGLSRSGVSVAVGRGEELMKNDPSLMELIDK